MPANQELPTAHVVPAPVKLEVVETTKSLSLANEAFIEILRAVIYGYSLKEETETETIANEIQTRQA